MAKELNVPKDSELIGKPNYDKNGKYTSTTYTTKKGK